MDLWSNLGTHCDSVFLILALYFTQCWPYTNTYVVVWQCYIVNCYACILYFTFTSQGRTGNPEARNCLQNSYVNSLSRIVTSAKCQRCNHCVTICHASSSSSEANCKVLYSVYSTCNTFTQKAVQQCSISRYWVCCPQERGSLQNMTYRQTFTKQHTLHAQTTHMQQTRTILTMMCSLHTPI